MVDFLYSLFFARRLVYAEHLLDFDVSAISDDYVSGRFVARVGLGVLNLADDFHALEHLAEDYMLAVEPVLCTILP